jgi:hypothetical protein
MLPPPRRTRQSRTSSRRGPKARPVPHSCGGPKSCTDPAAQPTGGCPATAERPSERGLVPIPPGGQPVNRLTRARLDAEVERLAARGYRVLAVAERPASGRTDLQDDRVARLELAGFVALSDPVRPSAAAALRGLRVGGVEVVMLTGDHPSTAEAIAAELDLVGRRRVVGGAELLMPRRRGCVGRRRDNPPPSARPRTGLPRRRGRRPGRCCRACPGRRPPHGGSRQGSR